ncbi:hypothetical protein JL722_8891 [Aureococcus anophagefferens]|nr:hypothetical protein JL722_8891 [Aureococcus anophagefferens]
MSLRLRSSIASRDDATRALRRLSAVRAVKDDERRRFSAALEGLGLGGAATLSPATSRPSSRRSAGPADADGWRTLRSGARGTARRGDRAARAERRRRPRARRGARAPGERAAPCDAAVAVAAAEPPGAGDGKE